jgi:hypothetical protein
VIYSAGLPGVGQFSVQSEIAASLVIARQVEVAADVLFPLRSSRETSPAYDTFLRGLHAAYRFDQRGFEEAVAYCRHALELDPSFVAPAEVLAIRLADRCSVGLHHEYCLAPA